MRTEPTLAHRPATTEMALPLDADRSFAWVTYADGDTYLRGARVLARSLLRVDSKFKLVVMVPFSFEAAARKTARDDENVTVVGREAIITDGGAFERYKHCLNKVYVWTLSQYSKVCWLDSDMVVVKNIDSLFKVGLSADGSEIAAGRGCTCNYFANPRLNTRPEDCPFSNPSKQYVNTGLFLAVPSDSVYQSLLLVDYDHPLNDQDAFNIHFSAEGRRIVDLPSSYNYLNHLALAHPLHTACAKHVHRCSCSDAYKNISVYHFCYGKPWDANTLQIGHQFYDYWTALLSELD